MSIFPAWRQALIRGEIQGHIFAADGQSTFNALFSNHQPIPVSAGTRVALLASPTLAFVQSLFQVWAQGALPCVLNPAQFRSQQAFAQFLSQYAISASWSAEQSWQKAAEPESAPHFWPPLKAQAFSQPEDPALVLMTSGSSGEAKGVVLSQAAIEANLTAVADAMHLQAAARVAVMLPLFHSFALITQVLLTLRTGGELHLLPTDSFPAERLDYFQKHQIQRVAGVPTHFRLLFQDKSLSLPSLEHIKVAGAALDPDSARRILEVCPRAELWVGYGLTEAGPRVSAISHQDPCFEDGSVGRAIPGVQLRIHKDEIQLKSPACFSGYLDRPDLTAEQWQGDWLRTGDSGFMQGAYLYVRGRRDSLILSAGEKISPLEIESVLLAHPGVDEVAVYGEDEALLGQQVAACIRGTASLRDLRKYARAELPAEKCPRSWYAVDSLPRTDNGKLRRKDLLTWPKQKYPLR